MARRGGTRTEALALAVAWWYLRRRVRKRAAGVAGLVAEESRKRHPLRWLAGVGLVVGAAAGLLWWRGRQGGGDDWGDWEPVEPVAPDPGEPAPEPLPDPVSA
jgi:hypothetical protein